LIRQISRRCDVDLLRHLLQDLTQLGLQRAMVAFGSLLKPLDDSVI
jgi:hypothetical protein